jgi:hypothetical protein
VRIIKDLGSGSDGIRLPALSLATYLPVLSKSENDPSPTGAIC